MPTYEASRSALPKTAMCAPIFSVRVFPYLLTQGHEKVESLRRFIKSRRREGPLSLCQSCNLLLHGRSIGSNSSPQAATKARHGVRNILRKPRTVLGDTPANAMPRHYAAATVARLLEAAHAVLKTPDRTIYRDFF